MNTYNWVWEIYMMVCNLSMSFYQARWFDTHMDGKTKFNHWPWALYYIINLIFAFFIDKSWVLVVELLLIRGVLFNPSLNLLRRKVKLPFFYIHQKGENGSWIDQIIYAITGKYYWILWSLELIVLSFLNYKFH